MGNRTWTSTLESDDVHSSDEQTAAYRQRTATALANYRAISNPSDFEPAPAAPEDDANPDQDPDGTGSMESNKVGYFDGLTATHRAKTAQELARFASDLQDYADDYEERTGETYDIPESAVVDTPVVDDGNERRLESNTVGAYDEALPGFYGVTSDSMDSFIVKKNNYDTYTSRANAKLDALGGTGNGSIQNQVRAVKQMIEDMPSEVADGLIDISEIEQDLPTN